MSKGLEHIIENALGYFGVKERSEACLACGEEKENEALGLSGIFAESDQLCKKCRNQLIPISGDTCIKCGRYLSWRKSDYEGKTKSGRESLFCPNCESEKNHYSLVISCYEYSGFCKELLHRLKYSNEPELAELFGRPMANALGQTLFESSGDFPVRTTEKMLRNAVLIPVPVSEDKMKDRGYNQALCLAKIIEKTSGIKTVDGLARKKETIVQHKLTKTQRNLNIMGAFSLNLEYNIFGKYIILVDDIFTTGSTANECARVLKTAGCQGVVVLTAAAGGKKSL